MSLNRCCFEVFLFLLRRSVVLEVLMLAVGCGWVGLPPVAPNFVYRGRKEFIFVDILIRNPVGFGDKFN